MKNQLQLNLLFSLLLLIPLWSFGQGFDCDNSAYLATYSSSGTSLYRMQVTEANGIQEVEPIFSNILDYQIRCIGYSVVDEMIYALDFITHDLLKINALGEIANLGRPIGLDTTLQYHAGAVFPEGKDLFVAGRSSVTQKDVAYYAINLKDVVATAVEFEGTINSTIQDMAINPRDGAFFGFDSGSNKIVNVDFGIVSNYQFPELPETFTSLFFDQSFNLYSYGSRTPGISQNFYSINKVNSEVSFLQEGSLAIDSDACACPYRFDFFKNISPKETIPCQEVLIEYSFLNVSGGPRSGLSLIDTLPDILTITDIDLGNPLNKFDAIINSGVGTNILDLSDVFILMADVHTIKVTAVVAADVDGTFTSQAHLNGLPLALNPAMVSDDLTTSLVDDSNELIVLDAANPDFPDSIVYNCDNTLATIFAPISNAKNYLWSDGSTEATLEVDRLGSYNVMMETECETFSVDVAVDFDQASIFVDLGEDLLRATGETFTLPYESNADSIIRYNWLAEDASIFSCTRCPNPAIRVLDRSTITLEITDDKDCQTSDEIVIEVQKEKDIYAPTAFSPNGDGYNDVFFLQGTNAILTNFRIFDRWGNLVFERQNTAVNDPSVGWKGDYQGQIFSLGIFIWYAEVQYLDGSEDLLKGTFGIVR